MSRPQRRATAGGRDQLSPTERVVRLLTLLAASDAPVPTQRLVQVGGYRTAAAEDAKRMLNRDLEQLNRQGWDIRNVAPAGEAGRYRLRARDNRLQVALSPAQRAELVRAAVAAGRPALAAQLGTPGARPAAAPTGVVDADSPPALDGVLRAVSRHCLLHFGYKEVVRVVHPYAVHPGPSGWYLRGREEGSALVKEFVVGRMAGVVLEHPGTAEPAPDAPRSGLDPLSWRVDPPVDVVVASSPEHRSLVEHLLGPPTTAAGEGDDVRLTFRVTHRAAFRWRLYELGLRVRLVGPDEVRREVLDELTAIAGGSA